MAYRPNAQPRSHVSSTVLGVAETGDDKRIRVNGRWYNISQWPDSIQGWDDGDTVELGLDDKQYVRTITVTQWAADSPAGPYINPATGELVTIPPPAPARPAAPAPLDRDRSIIRQVALKAAVRTAQSYPGLIGDLADGLAEDGDSQNSLMVAAVLWVAAKYEEWLNRPA